MPIALLTRRTASQVLAGAMLGRLFPRGRAADLAAIQHLSWDAAPGPAGGLERRYLAHAQVLVLSLPIVRWPNVGGGSAVWREISSPEKSVLRFLEFTGFSNPARAAGLNRMGFIREISRVQGSAGESLYFGLMTASPEETAEEARKALHPKGKQAAYTAIDGRLDGAGVATVVAHFTAPSQWSVANRNDLIQLARTALAMTPPRAPEGEARGGEIRPFLQTLADALRAADSAERRFAYAGRFYRLSLERAPDPKATTAFRQRGLAGSGKQVVRVSGKLRRESGGKQTNFRLWVEDGAAQPVPLRIEYQAKSYLRLIFEAEA
jgi:hypothetical protein